MKTKNITISGGFHNVNPITLRAQVDTRACGGVTLSVGQVKRLRRHMCGIYGCICGMHHGWVIEGSDRGELSEAINEVDVEEYRNH